MQWKKPSTAVDSKRVIAHVCLCVTSFKPKLNLEVTNPSPLCNDSISAAAKSSPRQSQLPSKQTQLLKNCKNQRFDKSSEKRKEIDKEWTDIRKVDLDDLIVSDLGLSGEDFLSISSK